MLTSLGISLSTLNSINHGVNILLKSLNSHLTMNSSVLWCRITFSVFSIFIYYPFLWTSQYVSFSIFFTFINIYSQFTLIYTLLFIQSLLHSFYLPFHFFSQKFEIVLYLNWHTLSLFTRRNLLGIKSVIICIICDILLFFWEFNHNFTVLFVLLVIINCFIFQLVHSVTFYTPQFIRHKKCNKMYYLWYFIVFLGI